MKNICAGLCSLLLSPPLLAQNLEQLQEQLTAQQAEIQELREQIKALERELMPVGQEHAAKMANEEIDEDSNRALERALVRERGLLLSPGTVELEANFAYSHRNNGSTGLRRDSFGPALAFREGLPRHSQLEVALPYVFERRDGSSVITRTQGIGDLSIGIAHQILNEKPSAPALIGAVNYLASTGRNTIFEDAAAPAALGSGFDAIQGTLTAVKRIDPLVLFGSYSFTHNYAKTYNGVRIDPGNSHGWRFGTGLATGPDTSLRAAFSLVFFDKMKFGDTPLSGTDDPMGMLELGGSVVLSEATALDVLVAVGVTENAPDFRLTAALPIRF